MRAESVIKLFLPAYVDAASHDETHLEDAGFESTHSTQLAWLVMMAKRGSNKPGLVGVTFPMGWNHKSGPAKASRPGLME